MTPLTTVLHTLDALLETKDVRVVEAADREIWDYLSTFDGLSKQSRALDELAEAFALRPASSPLHRTICTLLAQHQRRLAEASV